MSLTPEELFRKAVGCVFNGWTALQLAVEHGMGGTHSRAKALSMIDAVIDFFKNKPNADWDEVADLLGDMMDDEFNTICEDDSTDEVGSLLWEFYKHCVSGDRELVEAEIAKLPTGNQWLSKCIDQTPHTSSTDSQEDTCACDNGDGSLQESEDNEMETQEVDPDPGWTQVSRRKK